MITFTENALADIQSLFPGAVFLRLEISPRGCGAPVVILEPGEPEKDDLRLQAGGRVVLADADLLKRTQSITLNSVNGRFTADLGVPVTVAGCGVCPASPLQGGACGITNGMNF